MPDSAVEILLVEDNPHDRELTLRALKKQGVANHIVTVQDGAEALDFLFCRGAYSDRNADNRPALIVLDLKLPKLDGVEVLRAIRGDNRTKTIPVVMLTSSRENADVAACYRTGVNSYVVKPVESGDFNQAVGQLGTYWMVLNNGPLGARPRRCTGMVKVLIVEDRPEDTELMVRELRQASLPLHSRAVASEREYRQSLDWIPDVILSDFSLPQFNAFDALRILDERMLDIPLIVVTGSISEEVAVDCIKLGAVDYLLKDRMARLPAAVASALDEKRLRDEKRRTEEQLKDREERLRLALESARMATWDWNLTTGDVRFSAEAGPLLGLSAGQSFSSIDEFLNVVYSEDRAAMKLAMISAADACTDYNVDFRVQWSDGSLHWIAARGRVLGHDQERAARMVGVVMDTTQRVRMEQEANQRLAQLAHVARLTTMGELVSELAHELNQPLYAIANFSEACLNLANSSWEAQPNDLVDWLEQIAEQSQRAGEIMRRVYGFVRKSPVHARSADINALVHDCLRLLQVNVRQQDVALRMELGHNLTPVFVDSVQIQQVLVNLITNAIESMADLPLGERCIVVRSNINEARDVEVSVCDRGRGAADVNAEENLERLFEPFFTTKSEGMGMGLSISRSIIEAHGGRLWVERNPDRGLTFRFTLPLVDKEK